MLSPDSMVSRMTHALSADAGGEVVIMHVKNGLYYALDATGAAIWSAIESPKSIADICSNLGQKFNVSKHQCLADVEEFLTAIQKEGLVQITPPRQE